MEASGSKRKHILVSSDRKRFRGNFVIKNGDAESDNDLTIYLPNHVVERIFTFLPIKDVVSSSLVAKPFLNSWLYARNLCFDKNFKLSCSLNGRKEIPIINNILNNHVGKKIHSFHLYIPVPTEYKSFFNGWIQLVAAKGLEELEIHLEKRFDGNFYYMYSDSINIETLCSLKLICCNLRLSPKPKGLRFLKSLSLTKVQVTPYFIKALFTSCVILESLALEDCSSSGDLTIKGSNKFRTLLIRGCKDIMLVTINSSSLSTFHYDGAINKIKLVDSIRLKDVILNFGATMGFQHMSERDDLIEILRNVQTLSINNILLEGLSPRYVNFDYIDMEYYLLNLKELQLVRRGMSFVNPWDIIFFVKNCPQIERLFLDFGTCAMEAGSYWNSVAKEKFENCQIEFSQLKLLKVKGFKKLELEEKLVKKISMHAKSLEFLILVESKNNHGEVKLSEDITVSKIATVSIYGHCKDQSFVFPKHRIV